MAGQNRVLSYIAGSVSVVVLALILYDNAPRKSRTSNPVLPAEVSPKLPVPDHINKPPWHQTGRTPLVLPPPEVHHDEQSLAKMRAACRLAARALQLGGSLVQPGTTTDEIDRRLHDFIVGHGGYPSALNYRGFPKGICTSVNEVICHGIPDSRPLQEGDIANLDVTVYLDGYHGDTSAMFFVGNVSNTARSLCQATQEALMAAIGVCGPGVSFKKVGQAVEAVAQRYGMRVVKHFTGHGIGRHFHASPSVFNYNHWWWPQGHMKVNQTFTIEPMLVEPGGGTSYRVAKDGWTITTADRSLSAMYEHTVLITDGGVEILTL